MKDFLVSAQLKLFTLLLQRKRSAFSGETLEGERRDPARRASGRRRRRASGCEGAAQRESPGGVVRDFVHRTRRQPGENLVGVAVAGRGTGRDSGRQRGVPQGHVHDHDLRGSAELRQRQRAAADGGEDQGQSDLRDDGGEAQPRGPRGDPADASQLQPGEATLRDGHRQDAGDDGEDERVAARQRPRRRRRERRDVEAAQQPARTRAETAEVRARGP